MKIKFKTIPNLNYSMCKSSSVYHSKALTILMIYRTWFWANLGKYFCYNFSLNENNLLVQI